MFGDVNVRQLHTKTESEQLHYFVTAVLYQVLQIVQHPSVGGFVRLESVAKLQWLTLKIRRAFVP